MYSLLSQELETSDNPVLQLSSADPTLFAAAYKKNRFYLFTRREPDEGRWATAWARVWWCVE